MRDIMAVRITYLRYEGEALTRVQHFGCHPHMSRLHKAYRARQLARRRRNHRCPQ